MGRAAGRLLRRGAAYAAKKPLRTLFFTLALVFFCLVGRFFFWPPVDYLAGVMPDGTAFMEYRQKQWRQEGKTVTLRHSPVPLDRISPYLRRAVVEAEDARFYDHWGFDWQAMREALFKNARRGRIAAGGSTLTQQLAKNLFLSPDKNFLRKAQEAVLAFRLELALDKDRILELYLNVAEWGQGVFGAEEAARRYFGVSASALTARQAALLAAMLPSPLRYTPGSGFVQRRAAGIERGIR